MPEDKEQDEELVREANLLTDLIVEKIAFVDEPADQDSQILVLKSQDGVEVESTNEDEAEEEQEGAEKAAGYISPSEIISALEAIMEAERDEKKKKRLNLVIANLKSFFGLKKAGKKISAANAAKIKQIAATLMESAKALMQLVETGYESYQKPYYQGYYQPEKQAKDDGSEQVTNILSPQLVIDAANKIASAMVSGAKYSAEELEAMSQAVKLLMDQINSKEKEGDLNA